MTSSTMPSPASISSVAAWVVAARGISLILSLGLEHVHRQALAGERQRGDDADRSAAGNQDGIAGEGVFIDSLSGWHVAIFL